ncbi:MAG: glycogen synthase [Candidatus Aminicenantes bacterium]|nr:MAG: glycogen synthase [Candidatus Aminicenantes bacterium]
MNQKLHVVFVSPEVSPFAKSGEMADVASSLPKYLSCLGMDVSVVMPKYRRSEIESLPKELVLRELLVPVGEKKIKAQIYKSELGKYDIYFVDNPQYFWRENIYGTGKGEYLDNDERFIFFNRAVLEFLLKAKMPVDVLHCNSWPTALIPVFLKTHYSKRNQFKKTATVFTLHNITYQGEFPPETLTLTGLNWNYFNPSQLSLNGRFNFLKAGVIFSDVLNTVSSNYKKEIEAKKHGFDLGEILDHRKDVFFSIRNGVDYEIWNPETDPFIVANYNSTNLKAKKKCKIDLIKEFGLSIPTKTPLLGTVSYMTAHKGFDILFEAMDELMEMDVGLVVLGQGDENYENKFLDFQKKYPRKIAVKIEMSPALTHKIAAGVDIILIPSLYEPCGLNQLYSFHYGTVPIVRATGGLGETVKPFSLKTLRGNGFLFREFSPQALLKAVKKALRCYKEPALWKKIMEAGFREDYSWKNAAKRYRKLYQRALEIKKGT